MRESEAEVRRKVRRAAHMLLFRKHMKPGVKGWELKKALGKNYSKVLELLDSELRGLGLMIKGVGEAGGQPRPEEMLYARYYVTFRGRPEWPEIRGSGWRIDEMAALTASLSLILSRGGKAKYEELDELLEQRMPSWRLKAILNRFFRLGYLARDENENAIVGWRSRVEIDLQRLMSLLLGKRAPMKEVTGLEEAEKAVTSGENEQEGGNP